MGNAVVHGESYPHFSAGVQLLGKVDGVNWLSRQTFDDGPSKEDARRILGEEYWNADADWLFDNKIATLNPGRNNIPAAEWNRLAGRIFHEVRKEFIAQGPMREHLKKDHLARIIQQRLRQERHAAVVQNPIVGNIRAPDVAQHNQEDSLSVLVVVELKLPGNWGMHVRDDGRIIDVTPGGIADDAGLQAGDEILTIDEHRVEDMQPSTLEAYSMGWTASIRRLKVRVYTPPEVALDAYLNVKQTPSWWRQTAANSEKYFQDSLDVIESKHDVASTVKPVTRSDQDANDGLDEPEISLQSAEHIRHNMERNHYLRRKFLAPQKQDAQDNANSAEEIRDRWPMERYGYGAAQFNRYVRSKRRVQS